MACCAKTTKRRRPGCVSTDHALATCHERAETYAPPGAIFVNCSQTGKPRRFRPIMARGRGRRRRVDRVEDARDDARPKHPANTGVVVSPRAAHEARPVGRTHRTAPLSSTARRWLIFRRFNLDPDRAPPRHVSAAHREAQVHRRPLASSSPPSGAACSSPAAPLLWVTPTS